MKFSSIEKYFTSLSNVSHQKLMQEVFQYWRSFKKEKRKGFSVFWTYACKESILILKKIWLRDFDEFTYFEESVYVCYFYRAALVYILQINTTRCMKFATVLSGQKNLTRYFISWKYITMSAIELQESGVNLQKWC